MTMGRKPTRWTNLPKGMRARPRGNLVHYYLDTGDKPRREIPLGSDYVQAVAKWAELTSKPAPVTAGPVTFLDALNGRGKCAGYRKDVLPSKAARTQQDNEKELAWLLQFFGDPPAPLDQIEPVHITQYMRWRVKAAKAAAEEKNAQRVKDGNEPLPIAPDLGHVRANREKALFSHVWNYAREEGLTKLPNPCAGVSGYDEEGRDAAPDDVLVGRVLAEADKPLEFAMRLADIVGQRPADVRRCSETDIEGPVPGGVLRVRQGKTQAKLRIVIVGALADLITEIRAYKREIAQERRAAGKPVIHTMALLVNEDGKALTYSMLRSRFDDARDRAGVKKDLFQFRDYRAKVATETDEAEGTRAAQAMLGHTTEGMTVRYIRNKVGRKVTPRK
jgi:integrase